MHFERQGERREAKVRSQTSRLGFDLDGDVSNKAEADWLGLATLYQSTQTNRPTSRDWLESRG